MRVAVLPRRLQLQSMLEYGIPKWIGSVVDCMGCLNYSFTDAQWAQLVFDGKALTLQQHAYIFKLALEGK